MNWLSGLHWFRSAPAPTGTAHPDPGDMGTAFGLDASLDVLPCAKPVETPPPRRTPWDRRLVRRPER